MAQTKQPSRSRHLDKVIAQVKNTPDIDDPEQLETFIRQYYDDIAAEDVLDHSPADLFGAARAHWEFAQARESGEAKLRVFNPTPERDGWKSTHTIFQMVDDDMPFLVDSAGMALAKYGLNIHLTVHPIIRLERDEHGRITHLLNPGEKGKHDVAESFMHMEIDRRTDAALLAEVEAEIREAMRDVRLTVADWTAMREQAMNIHRSLDEHALPLDQKEIDEGKSFIEWLAHDHFTFLGYREYKLVTEKGEDILRIVPDSGLGILRDTGPKDISKSFMVLPQHVRARAHAKELLIITKANSRTTVHRPGCLDYIGIKQFNDAGEVEGEWRFLGLFTSSAYSRSPREIPLLRQKVAGVMERSGLPPASHGGKALLHILETFPRDELFQSTVDELYETTTGVLQIQERHRVKLFIRRDSFGRFYSCLAYVPRDRYNTQIRERIQDILHDALNGRYLESAVQLSESVLARVHIIVRTAAQQSPEFDRRKLEDHIAQAVRSWSDELRDELIERFGEESGLRLFSRYGDNFPAAYKEDVKPKAAAFDIEQMDALDDDSTLRMSLYHPSHYPASLLRFKTFHREQPIPISDALPMLENMGVKVISERPYETDLDDESIIWIQDIEMICNQEFELDLSELRDRFQETFAQVWQGEAENDGFNRLVLLSALNWRQVTLIRAYCKYLLQTGIPFSQAYMEQTLTANPRIAGKLVALFEMRFDPSQETATRSDGEQRLIQELQTALDSVASLDEDRILRGFFNVISATLRTNYYQTREGEIKPYIAVKLDPAKVPDLPLPRPMYEVWVYSPRTEAVHLRGNKVARGGIRWSDRREDFRTEVLGLMKAQTVKNAVIVPVGAKGGFVVKRAPVEEKSREALMEEVITCYQTFMRGLLDITDNLIADEVAPPPDVVRVDEDDPYLVVAADKGTATFSDMANAIAKDYGFWLGDAFASGGSAGYDHKEIGITARGAWESVKRHFRELGIDIQTRDFTAIGIGDMAGDVFGNGMLLSRHIKLKAAFNHMHIFLDPDPDPETSYAERERMFNLPRSTWNDYNTDLISAGGGVFSRNVKTIRLSREARQALDIESEALTPQELIKAILKAPVDLWWNGGIGTYVKSSSENNVDVGDRANDTVRVNGRELRCRAVGEGGNLGLTQRGRIEYALNGGRINTDFIDNSAGVDCSDHEVNIKILLNPALEGELTETERNSLLADMTEEVAALVLRDNYMQAQAISITESQAVTRLNEYAYLMRVLERRGELNRGLEFLPSEEDLAERRAANRGLTRPELCVLLAYSKITIYSALLNSDVPEDPYLGGELTSYFPEALQKRYEQLMPQHRLGREIIATTITNSMVNRMGPTFAHRLEEDTGVNAAAVAKAYTIARESFDMPGIWAGIEALDNHAPTDVQVAMEVQIGRLIKHATTWLLEHLRRKVDIAAQVSTYAPGIRELGERITDMLAPSQLDLYHQSVQQFTDVGVPGSLAHRIASLNPLYGGMDIVDVAGELSVDVQRVGRCYYHLGARLDLDWLRAEIEQLDIEGHWQAVARATLREDLYAQQRRLTAKVLATCGRTGDDPESCLEQWIQTYPDRTEHALRVLNDIKSAVSTDFASLSVALQEVRRLARIGTAAKAA